MKKFIVLSLVCFIINIGCKQEKTEDWPTSDRLSNKFRIYEGDILDYKQHDRRNKTKALKFIKEKIVPKVEMIIQGIIENNPKVIIEMYDESDIRHAQYFKTHDGYQLKRYSTQEIKLVKGLNLAQFKEKMLDYIRADDVEGPYSDIRSLLDLKEEILADNARFFISGIDESDSLADTALIDVYISNVNDRKPYGGENPIQFYFYSQAKDFNFKLGVNPIPY